MKRIVSVALAASSCHIVSGLDDATEPDAASSASSSVSASVGGYGGSACNAYEPNDTGQMIPVLPPITTAETSSIQASLRPGDVDWYVYDATDVVTEVNPSIRLQVDREGAEACAFVKCRSAPAPYVLECSPGYATETDLTLNLPGCCGPSGGTMQSFLVDCGTPNLDQKDDAKIYVRVSDVSGAQCEEYTLTYGYN